MSSKVPVQRVTKYPLLLARLLKATPFIRTDIQEAKNRLQQAQTNIELHLEHMNAVSKTHPRKLIGSLYSKYSLSLQEAKDVTSTKLWRKISIIQNNRKTSGEQEMVNIKLRKVSIPKFVQFGVNVSWY